VPKPNGAGVAVEAATDVEAAGAPNEELGVDAPPKPNVKLLLLPLLGGTIALATCTGAAPPGAGDSHDAHTTAPGLLLSRHTSHAQPPGAGPKRPTRSEKSVAFELVGCADATDGGAK